MRDKHLQQDPIVTLVIRGKHSTFDDNNFVTIGEPLANEVRTCSIREFKDEKEEADQLGIVQSVLRSRKGASVDRGTFREFL